MLYKVSSAFNNHNFKSSCINNLFNQWHYVDIKPNYRHTNPCLCSYLSISRHDNLDHLNADSYRWLYTCQIYHV